MHIFVQNIGHKIKERRRFLKITQKDLSEMAGISLRSLIQVENGSTNITIIQLSKILDTLGLTIEIKVR